MAGTGPKVPEQAQDLPPLRDVIARFDLGARKSLGQHFLLDLNLTGRIARCAGDLSDATVIEIGPGPGGLTRALLKEGAGQVIAIERDSRCLEALAQLEGHYPSRLRLIEGDALECPLAGLGAAPRWVIANLPYNISTALLVNWLREIHRDTTCFAGLVLMFQKEVASRLTAEPRSKDYGRLSVMTQWLCDAKCLFDIPPRAFTPPPKVVSTVVHLAPRKHREVSLPFEAMERTVAAGFGQRRKMLRQSLKSLRGETAAALAALGIPETARAEELTVEDFARLAQELGKSA